VLGKGEIPESARNCSCCALAGMTIFGCAEAQSLTKEGAGGAMVASSRSEVVKVPVVGEDFREEVRTREVFAEKAFNSRRVGMESRQVSRVQGDAVLVEAGEVFVVGVVRDDYVVFVKVEQEGGPDR
jgi:hypothetical protein